ncbi:MAG: sugar phosphate isomerase/epimerase [Planctomycetota bacterium]
MAITTKEFAPRYCLNTSTIRGQKLTIEQEIELAAMAGYDGIEPWINEINDYVKRGGKLAELKQRIADLGLTVESAIGFAQWIVDDEAKRKKALDDARRDMELVKAIGGTRIAAPPAGATDRTEMNLFTIAERYRALLEVGADVGVTPQLEVWGFSKTLSRLGETALAAIEAGHPDACILPDFYHIYKGGSSLTGLQLISPSRIHCFHMNDYPADPPREKIGDKDRVYPGDGVSPLGPAIRHLAEGGWQGAFSLELFNRDYWKQDATHVAQTGLEKMKAAVAKAVG